MTRQQLERFWSTREPCRVVMEGCSGSHYWARLLIGLGFEVKLIPPHYVVPYRRRNKTDRADCKAILEADRCAGIHGIAVKSEAQLAIMALHRVRSQWMATRTARINAMRGMLRDLDVEHRRRSHHEREQHAQRTGIRIEELENLGHWPD